MSAFLWVMAGIEIVVVLYTLTYLLCNVVLTLAGFKPVLDDIRGLGYHDLDLMDDEEAGTPSVAVLVPAYNEETTIVESVRSLMELDYPKLEIIAVNDGSNDDTKQRLREAFAMRRKDVPTRQDLETTHVRGIYETTVGLPAHVSRFVLVDKENGGRSDALNAGINVCVSTHIVTLDADSILDQSALKQVVRLLQRSPDIIAAGGQIGVVNESLVSNGQVIKAAVPKAYLVLCQTMEYLRSFSIMRTGFTRLNGLIILSGAFMVMPRNKVIEVGGFLTGRSSSKLLDEYVGLGKSTICEDMEIVVRMHRYEREQGRIGRVAHTPVPVCWTEVPDNIDALGKQRRRWHRGLIEILRYNKRMYFNPDYGRIGLFSIPYFVLFECVGPYVEFMGLILLPLLAVFGILDPVRVALITGFALGAGVLHSLVAVLCATWLQPFTPVGKQVRSLSRADRWRDRLLLIAGCFLTELGYRQMTLFWRLWGTWDYMRGRKGWDKFARKGFKVATTSVLAALLLIVPGNGHAQSDAPLNQEESRSEREAMALVGHEQRDGRSLSWWSEAYMSWKYEAGKKYWVGLSHRERTHRSDVGPILGFADKPWRRFGYGVELRVAPTASFSPKLAFLGESETVLGERVTGSVRLRYSQYATARIYGLEMGPVAYLPKRWWWANRVQMFASQFPGGRHSVIWGWLSFLSTRFDDTEIRLRVQRGGESYLEEGSLELREIRAFVWGVEVRQPIGTQWKAVTGFASRQPDRGLDGLYLHLAFLRKW